MMLYLMSWQLSTLVYWTAISRFHSTLSDHISLPASKAFTLWQMESLPLRLQLRSRLEFPLRPLLKMKESNWQQFRWDEFMKLIVLHLTMALIKGTSLNYFGRKFIFRCSIFFSIRYLRDWALQTVTVWSSTPIWPKLYYFCQCWDPTQFVQ